MSPRARSARFPREPGAPAPLAVELPRRVGFGEADPMGIAWFGRYAVFFEEGAAELGRRCGLSYADYYEAGLRAPVVRYHVEYFRPLRLDEAFTIRCALIWCEGARLNFEYTLTAADGVPTAAGQTVQLLVSAASGEVCLTPPPLLARCRKRWRAGEFAALQA